MEPAVVNAVVPVGENALDGAVVAALAMAGLHNVIVTFTVAVNIVMVLIKVNRISLSTPAFSSK